MYCSDENVAKRFLAMKIMDPVPYLIYIYIYIYVHHIYAPVIHCAIRRAIAEVKFKIFHRW